MLPLFEKNGGLEIQLKDVRSMLDFSEFMVQSEIQIAHYTQKTAVIGGPVQMLLLENDEAKWIHSLY